MLVTDLKVSVRTYYSPVGGTQVWPTTQVFWVGFFQLRISVKRVRQINDLSKKINLKKVELVTRPGVTKPRGGIVHQVGHLFFTK